MSAAENNASVIANSLEFISLCIGRYWLQRKVLKCAKVSCRILLVLKFEHFRIQIASRFEPFKFSSKTCEALQLAGQLKRLA